MNWSGAARLLSAAALLWVVEPRIALAERWVIAFDENFPPYAFLAAGEPVGIDTEIVDAVLLRMGIEVVHRPLPWSRVIAELDEDKVDLAFQFAGTAQRQKSYHLVGPLRSGLTVFATRPGTFVRFRSLRDLKDMVIGTVQNFAYTTEFDTADYLMKDSTATSNTANVRKLVAGRVDLVIGDLYTLRYVARQEALAEQLQIVEPPIGEVPRFVAFPWSRSAKGERFGAALEEFRKEGGVDRVIARWMRD